MRIGLDIDDTICNTNFIIMKYAYKYNNENGKKELLKYNTNDLSEVFGWNKDEVNLFLKKYYLDILKEIEPKFNVKEILNKLKNDGHEIIFITVRGNNDYGVENDAYRITAEWLKKFDIPYNELHIGILDKKEFCKRNKIDVFMDDSEKTCISVSQLGIKTFIAMNTFNQDFKEEKITNIYSMNEFYKEIQKLQQSAMGNVDKLQKNKNPSLHESGGCE